MKLISRRELMTSLGAMIGIPLVESTAWSGCWGCRRPAVDMPVSLARGTVKTPEFAVKHEPYQIIVEVQKRLPFADLNCMLGLTSGPLDPNNCDKPPLLQANWSISDQGAVVEQGSSHHRDHAGAWAQNSIDRIIGVFIGKKNRKYVLEVEFTTDAGALNVTDPHLIVMMSKPTD